MTPTNPMIRLVERGEEIENKATKVKFKAGENGAWGGQGYLVAIGEGIEEWFTCPAKEVYLGKVHINKNGGNNALKIEHACNAHSSYLAIIRTLWEAVENAKRCMLKSGMEIREDPSSLKASEYWRMALEHLDDAEEKSIALARGALGEG